MKNEPVIFPAYFKYTVILLGIVLTFYAIIEARMILIPFSISLIFALLLTPFVKKLERRNIPRSIASVISIILVLAAVTTIIYMLSVQIGRISREMPEIEAKLAETLDRGQSYLERELKIDQRKQTSYIKQAVKNFFENSSTVYKTPFSITAGLLNYLIIVPIALFFLLYYRKFLRDFLYQLLPRQQHDKLAQVLFEVQGVIHNYIIGLFAVIGIVAVLNTLGLYMLGINHAIFFGALAALLTIIPYVGIIMGSLLPVIYAFITTDSLIYPLGVALVFWFVQLLEGNFITPKIVGGKVSLNPFAVIIALLIGGKVWGPAGMILFIPFLAMLKVIFDVIDPLKPWGFVLGVHEVKQEKRIFRRWSMKINHWFRK